MTRAARSRRVVRGAIGFAVLFVAAEAATRAELVDPAWLPPASSVVVTIGSLLLDPDFLGHLATTIAAALLGLTLAAAAGIALGVVLGSSRRAHRATIAAIELLRPIPSVALIPLVVLVLGRGLDMRVTIVAYASVWPILLNTVTGVRAVDRVALETARAYGLGPVATARHVSLPAASPFVFTGIRISAAIALVLAISAELVAGGGAGLGVWMLEASQAGVRRELLYAGVVVAGMLGWGLDTAMRAGERRLFAWHQRVRAGP